MNKLTGFSFQGITEQLLSVDALLSSQYPYDQGLIKIVRDGGSFDAFSLMDVLSSEDKPIKVEAMERFNQKLYDECYRLASYFDHFGPVTCHLFKSPKDSTSFPLHEDLDDVVVHMVRGKKIFESPSGDFELLEGESIFIPRGVKHRAVNVEDSLMLSFGLERFIIEKL
jgi:mannose-6-phosphate isomerase-like protein (cupin superfamily)